MKRLFATISKIVTVLLLIFFLGVSCTSYKDLVYLRDIEEDSIFIPTKNTNYLIQSGDLLYIKISPASDSFIGESTTQINNLYTNESSFYIYGYEVNDSGFVDIPIFGLIQLKNHTMAQAKEKLSKAITQYYKQATLTVKLLSFKYSVLGEVTTPGVYQSFSKNTSVFEAIARAGEITTYGTRNNILLLRETEKGIVTAKLDLTKKDVIHSNYFYLQPNDILYISPNKTKNFKNNTGAISITLGAISTIILILNFVRTN